MSYITPGHVQAFQMIRSPVWHDYVQLLSCLVNGEPGVLIAAMDRVSEDQIAVMPLFVAITPRMRIRMVEGKGRRGGNGDGGPDRAERGDEAQRPADAFAANKIEVTDLKFV